MGGLTYNLEVQSTGNKAFLAFLKRLDISGPEYENLKKDIGETLRDQTVNRFIAEIDLFEKPWKPSQRAVDQGGQTLTDTGRLKNSITFNVGGDFIEVGTNVEYAEPLQLGSNKNNLEPRPFLGLGFGDGEEVLDIIKVFLKGLQ
jgi:phage gpG-like protein